VANVAAEAEGNDLAFAQVDDGTWSRTERIAVVCQLLLTEHRKLGQVFRLGDECLQRRISGPNARYSCLYSELGLVE